MMSVSVPVGRSFLYCLADFLPCLKAPALECQRAQHLPPRLDQVQVSGVLGLADELSAGVPHWPETREEYLERLRNTRRQVSLAEPASGCTKAARIVAAIISWADFGTSARALRTK